MIDVRAQIVDAVTTITGRARITIEMEPTPELDDYTSAPGVPAPDLRVRIGKWRRSRSLDANAYFWSMVAQIQSVTGQSQAEVYRMLIRRYGQYTYLIATEEAIPRLRMLYRDVEVLGDAETEKGSGKRLLVYFGSSTYDSREMSQLIDGTADEVRALGLTPPPTREMQAAISEIGKTERR